MGISRLYLALDHNFPVDPLGIRWPPEIDLVRLVDIDPSLVRDHEDWEILYHLNQRGDIHGFVTCDADMLALTREMVMLGDTHLTLIVTNGVGHDPIRATALLFLHLSEIAKRVLPRPQVFVLRPSPLRPERPGTYINKLAAAQYVQPERLISQERAAMDEDLRSRGGPGLGR